MITRLPRLVLSVVTGLVLATGLFAQATAPAAAPAAKPVAPTIDFPAPSPAATVKQRVGFTDIEINYSRPSMRGRKIFGGLQPYGEIWRTGANSATKITFSTPVKFGGADVPAGSYALFSLPGESEWTVILNKVVGQWGAYAYDEKNDFVRVKAVPLPLPVAVETFAISFNDLANESAATLYLNWENVRVPVKIEVDVVSTLVPQIESVMASDTSKKPYFRAAMFYYENNLDLKKALAWMDAAIAAQPDAFYYVYRKALVQEKMGEKEGAIATAKASIAGANKDPKTPALLRDEYVRLNEALIARLSGMAPAPASQPAMPAKPRVASSGGTSPHETIGRVIGDRNTGNRVTVTYGRPFSKDPKTGDIRKIWGALVPWDKAYRLGADEATLLLTQQPIMFGETTLPAGAYTLYMVPSETGASKLVISSNLGKWGMPVDETHDIARVDLKKESLEKMLDQLTLAIESDKATGGGVLKIMWENTQFAAPFTVKK